MTIKKKGSRLLALLLVVVTLFSTFAVTAQAATIADGSMSVTLEKKERNTYLKTTAGNAIGGSGYKYTTNDGITGVEVDRPLSVYAFEGGIRIFCGQDHTGLNIVDTMGRTVYFLDTVTDGTVVELPAGIYMLTTDFCHKPVKFIVK